MAEHRDPHPPEPESTRAGDAHPLDGLRVVDFSSDIAGGDCTMLLADAGADVVKVPETARQSWRQK